MISAILGLMGTAASGALSYFNNKKAQQQADSEFAREQAYAEAKAAENPLARSDNRAYIGEYDRAAEKQVQTNRARNKILGATPEADIAVQGKVAEGRASLLSGLAQNSAANKDKWDAVAEQSRQNQAKYNQDLAAQRDQTYAALAANAANSIGSMWDKGSSEALTSTDNTAETSAPSVDTNNVQSESNAKGATGMAQQIAQNKQTVLDVTGQNPYDTNAPQLTAPELKYQPNKPKYGIGNYTIPRPKYM